MNLAEFLLARIAEDEDALHALWRRAQETRLTLQDPKVAGRWIPGWQDWPNVEALTVRVLADCKAKRAIVKAEVLRDVGPASHYVNAEVHAQIAARTATPVLRLLALPYADHPDYREEWKP
jgi:hypothetical protein